MPSNQAIRASAVTSALGVNIDMTQGNWSTIPTVISQAQYIGASNVRLLAPTQNNWTVQYGYVDQLAQAGLKMDFVAETSSTPAQNANAIAAFVQAHPGSVALVEAPNEPNNQGVNYNGQSGVVGAIAWQQDFYTDLKANPLTAGITVAGIVSYPVVAAASDENNLHFYTSNGDEPGALLPQGLAQQEAMEPNKPFAITEFGWSTKLISGSGGSGWVPVDEATQAKLTLNGYMDAAKLGATTINIYNLRDYGYSDFGSGFGMFHYDNTPKIVATALDNMKSVLADTGATAASFATGSLNYTISGATDVSSMLIEKLNGEYVLALWREPDIWNAANASPIAASSEHVTVNLANAATMSLYDPMVGQNAESTVTSTSVGVDVTDHPLLITVDAATAQALVFSAAGSASSPAVALASASVATTADLGSGSDTLVLKLSQDAYLGSAQYTVSVDGQQVGGTLTASALKGQGDDTLTLHGNWGAGSHAVSVDFLNDAWGGTATTDRNLYLDSATYDGIAATGSLTLLGTGSQSLLVNASQQTAMAWHASAHDYLHG